MMDSEPTLTAQHAQMADLVPSLNIENLLRLRICLIERFERITDLLREANDIAAAGHLGSFDVRLSHGRDSYPFSAVDIMQVLLRQIDAAAWGYLMEESGLWTFMDATARETWTKQLGKGEIPALTRENIIATFKHLYGARREMFERGVVECWRWLSWDYSTNQPVKFGRRIILKYLFERPRGSDGHWLWPSPSATKELDDLNRVLAVLDGRAEPSHRQGMHREIRRVQNAGQMWWEGEYFTLRWYWKGTGHLTFKRMDLVEQMNAILAKHCPGALPAPRL